MLDAMKRRDLLDACQSAQQKRSTIKTQIAQFQESLLKAENSLAAMSATVSLPSQPRVLNMVTCSAKPSTSAANRR